MLKRKWPLYKLQQIDDTATIEMVDGHVQLKDQMQDYVHRGDALEQWPYLDFFLGTYDGKNLKEITTARWRIPNTRIPYCENCGRNGHARIVRSPDHETMPYFAGSWFAKRDPEDVNGLFEASMLALLKPWRSLKELKNVEETFKHAFDKFLATAPPEIHRTIANIEFFHECSEAATIHRQSAEMATEPVVDERHERSMPDNEEQMEERSFLIVHPFTRNITDEEIQQVTDNPFSAQCGLWAVVRRVTHARSELESNKTLRIRRRAKTEYVLYLESNKTLSRCK